MLGRSLGAFLEESRPEIPRQSLIAPLRHALRNADHQTRLAGTG
ncbi:MAG: hypothetical protein AAGA56_26755 [Myxococcota bacterium]